MGQKLSPAQQRLYQAVDEVLHYVWDPIGVSGIPEARDEYHGYLPKVFALLNEGCGEGEIATYLRLIATEHMGLQANPEHDGRTVALLIQWRDAINESGR